MSDETKQETESNLETIIEVNETTTEKVETTKEIIDNTMENDKNVEPVIKKKKAVRKPKQVLDTSDENIKVVLKSKKPGPRKKIVYIYKEQIEEEPIQIVEKIKRKAGRPKKE